MARRKHTVAWSTTQAAYEAEFTAPRIGRQVQVLINAIEKRAKEEGTTLDKGTGVITITYNVEAKP